jgi:hypothetical protein
MKILQRVRCLRVVLLSAEDALGLIVVHSWHRPDGSGGLIYDRRRAKTLRLSRRHAGVPLASDVLGRERPETIVQKIDECRRKDPVDLVIAGALNAPDLLARMHAMLVPPVLRMPDRATLALLNGKWQFHYLCVPCAGLRLPRAREGVIAAARQILPRRHRGADRHPAAEVRKILDSRVGPALAEGRAERGRPCRRPDTGSTG